MFIKISSFLLGGHDMKIQIIGYSGSGKSTLAKKLSQHYHLPLLYLDCVQFYGEWQERSLEEKNRIVDDFLNQHDKWVIDGNYHQVSPQRFQQCDMIIYLNYSRFYCFYKALQRYVQNIGKKRESCPCTEKFDLEFMKWLLIDGRSKKYQKMHLAHYRQCQGIRLMFKNRHQLEKYFKENTIK